MLSWIDLLVLIIISIFVIFGISRGLINQIFSIASVVGGIFLGIILYDIVGNALIQHELIDDLSVANVLGFVVITIVSFLIIQTAGWVILKMIGTLKLGWINRLGGGFVGFLLGIIISFFAISTLELFVGEKNQNKIKKSEIIPYVFISYGYIKNAVPSDLRLEYEKTKKIIRDKGLKATIK